MTTQYGFYHNNDICIGCRVCVIACKDKYNLPLGEKFRRVYDYGGGSWETDETGVSRSKGMFVYAVSTACMHCAVPMCFASCPVGAIIKRDDGIVYIDAETCIGCDACMAACPYGVPYLSAESGVARKCDFCMDYIDNGEDPACVASCPLRCLHYGEYEELKSTYGEINQVEPLPRDTSTDPSVVFTRSRFNPDGSLPGSILNAPEEIESKTV